MEFLAQRNFDNSRASVINECACSHLFMCAELYLLYVHSIFPWLKPLGAAQTVGNNQLARNSTFVIDFLDFCRKVEDYFCIVMDGKTEGGLIINTN